MVKVLLNDGSSKTLMVDERQNVREVLDNLFEKTHCDCNVDWSLCETNPELQLGRWCRLWQLLWQLSRFPEKLCSITSKPASATWWFCWSLAHLSA